MTNVNPKSGVIPDDKQVPLPVAGVSQVQVKEHEPGGSRSDEDKLMAEIRAVSETDDQRHLESVQDLIKDAKRAEPEPQLPPDVEDAGVISPVIEAEKVISEGTTLELPIDEEAYKRGLHVKVAGAVVDKAVVGVSGLTALAMWVARLIKKAHKHTMRVVFRRPPAPKEGINDAY